MNNADQFAALCKKYGVAPEDYAETFRRPVDAAIQAIGRPNYSEGFWFTPYKERLKAGEDKFRELLKERISTPTLTNKNTKGGYGMPHTTFSGAWKLTWNGG